MSDPKELDEIREKLREVMPHLRHGMAKAREEAGPDDVIQLAVVVKKPDNTGKVIFQLEAPEFFADIAKVLGLPAENTKEEDMEAKAVEFLDLLGLRRPKS